MRDRCFFLVHVSFLLFAVPTASFSLPHGKPFEVSSSLLSSRDDKYRRTHLQLSVSDVYQSCVDHYYYPTQSLLGAASAILGDAIAQLTEHKEEDESESVENNDIICNDNIKALYDMQRGAAYFCKGLGGGIIWALWFDFADVWTNDLTQAILSWSHAMDASPSTAATLDFEQQAIQTVLSISLEQFLVCPLLYGLWDIPLTAVLLGSPLRQVPAQIDEKLGPLLVNNAKIWTVVNIVTYNIPVEYRVLFSSAADVVWQAINARITSQEIALSPPPPPAPALAVKEDFKGSATASSRLSRRREAGVSGL
jgi:Mpv17 / PMP22 family